MAPVVAIASGKGGTGKTTVAVNMAAASTSPVTLLDCDVEEPNVHLFLKPERTKKERFTVSSPTVDLDACTGCEACREFCRFNAVVVISGKPTFFTDLCHSCGGCAMVCPEKAIHEVPRQVGHVESGVWKHVAVVHGCLDVGEAMSPPLIRQVRARGGRKGTVLIDAPPGTSCPVVTAVQGVDFVVLVTEPTPFGLNDLRMAVDMVRALGSRVGVIVNRADMGDKAVFDFCSAENIPLLGQIPYDRSLAEICSHGKVAAEIVPGYRRLFSSLLEKTIQEAGR
jgi:MinD superfamily P-loop ATPase